MFIEHFVAMHDSISHLLSLSPLRKSSKASTIDELVIEQLEHFGVNPKTAQGVAFAGLVKSVYQCRDDSKKLLECGAESLKKAGELSISEFNARKFLSFQLAKLLDDLQQPFRESYQGLSYAESTQLAKGPYPVFDNIAAIFSATPVICRTATYIYACAEWVADAFEGKEFMLDIYSRLLNPTSIALANHIVDLETGRYANEYMAWNFNSGMAAIDATFSHLLKQNDILITSRSIYGGVWQLIHDWYASDRHLNIAVHEFDGLMASDLERVLESINHLCVERIKAGASIYLYLESPSNPHGDVLDVPRLCELAHSKNMRVILDGTIATPFLSNPLKRENPLQRPDFLIHSYTKDIIGNGSAIAGCVIARNEDMFLPKNHEKNGLHWQETMFWNVYYIKGAFLSADAAFDVMQGMKTLSLRMLEKCINTVVLTKFIQSHPMIGVRSSALDDSPSEMLRKDQLFLGLPSPLLTFDMPAVPLDSFRRFFDMLSPTFGHMISLGQSNTIVSCPALTTHSELDDEALSLNGISKTTVRVAVGDESAMDLVKHLVEAARLSIDPKVAGFSDKFMSQEKAGRLFVETYSRIHQEYARSMVDSFGEN